MDNITHSLFALTLARTPLGRDVRGRTAALLLASNAPDIDIVALARGSAGYLKWHRSITHGPLGIVALGVVTAAVVHIGLRFWKRGPSAARSSIVALIGLSTLAAFLHVLMDLPTSYGTRLLSPFDWHWFTTDSIPIVDIYLWIALAAGLYWGRSCQAAGQRSAAIVLTLMMANYGLRIAAHERAISLAPQALGQALPTSCRQVGPPFPIVARWPRDTPFIQPAPGEPPCLVEVAAIPSMLSPFDWRLIVQTSSAYELRDVSVLGTRRGAGPEVIGPSRYPNAWTTRAVEAAVAPTTNVFLGFSRFPAVQSFVDASGGVTVQFADVRFVGVGPPGRDQPRGNPSGPNSRGLFGSIVRFSADGSRIDDRLGP